MNTHIAIGVIGGLVVGTVAAAWFLAPTLFTGTNSESMTLTLTTEAFAHNGSIPPAYTCDGDRSRHPEMTISGIPDATVSLVLLMDDPDIPQVFKEQRGIEAFDHWVLFNIPPTTSRITPDAPVGTLGVNSAGDTGYTGPCPPPEYEPTEHRYIFTLYALDTELALEAGATKHEVLEALQGHVIEQAELIGRYDRAE